MIPMKLRLIGCVLTASLFAATAYAIDIDDAKRQGLIGEKQDGYLGAVQSNPEIEALVGDINAKRKAHYQEIASKNGTSIQEVQKAGAKKAFEKSPAGSYVESAPGEWRKK